MSGNKKAVETSLLPQYALSPAFMERFLDAAHYDDKEIERSPNNKGIKLVDGSEMDADALDYFEDQKADLEDEFYQELCNRIGQPKADWFCDVIANDWFDGRGLRNGPRVVDLKRTIQASMQVMHKAKDLSRFVEHPILPPGSATLDVSDMAEILSVNRIHFLEHIEKWKEQHANAPFLSNDDIFLRRGLSLPSPLDVSLPYKEWDYINSYSLAFSAPEKFAQMQAGRTPAIINGDFHKFDGRVLFFSPFIRGMVVGQLEVGVIPSANDEFLAEQGLHGDMLEYIII